MEEKKQGDLVIIDDAGDVTPETWKIISSGCLREKGHRVVVCHCAKCKDGHYQSEASE